MRRLILCFAVAAFPVPPAQARTVDSPRLFGSLVSAFETAFEYETTASWAASLEAPLGERSSTVAGASLLSHDPSRDPGSDSWEFRSLELAGHLSIRRYPWEWAPGFFAQATAGYARRWEDMPGYVPLPVGESRWPGELWIIRREKERLETALGLGYLWKAGPLLIDFRFALGPEWIVLREYDETGRVERSRWLGSLLRFKDLEVGFSL